MVLLYKRYLHVFHYLSLFLGFLGIFLCDLSLFSFDKIHFLYLENSFFESLTLIYLAAGIYLSYKNKKFFFMFLYLFFFLEESSYGQ
ncbi:MAG: hypothetical protein CME60_14275 [Halobacteriovoraceae bacterium]|nr:hypothetical protein [Halobacteriovoraceae bacterium]